jgi:hypothetical protein
MIWDANRTMKRRAYSVLILSLFFVAPVLSADNLYDGFKNPPVSARPVARWCWGTNSPGEKEIIRQLDAFKKAGFSGVEIAPGEDVNGQLFKFAADAAKQRGMIVDLSLGDTLGGSFVPSAEQGRQIVISKKQFTGPTSSVLNVNDFVNLADPNCKLVFLRLVQTDVTSLKPGEELIEKVRPDWSVTIDINDANRYTLYAGVMHSVTTATGAAALDLFNRQAVEKYFKIISAKFSPSPGGKLGDSVRAVICPSADFSSANWAGDFQQEFIKQYGYDIILYLPLILDSNFPVERTRFSDTIRRTRFNFYTFLADTYRENFVLTFQKFCRDNGVLSCIPTGPIDILDICSVPTDIMRGYASSDPISHNAWDKIASSAAHFADKSLVAGEVITDASGNLESVKRNTDIAFASGINQSILPCGSSPDAKNRTEHDARLSYLFQSARYQARIAIICPRGDLWSDCGPLESRMVGYFWYMFPLWQALNQNGYTVDFVSEKNFPETTFKDGKLHFGARIYDAVIVPDMFLMEFPTAKALRFFAANGGKIAFIGREPLSGAGYKDFIQRGVPVDLAMRKVKENDPNRVLFIPAPQKDKDNLLSWTSGLMKKISVLPTVKISPPSDKLLFVHYLAEDRDIFFFTNTDNAAAISFRADFNTPGKTPWLWNPDTGKRDKFANSGKSGDLNIKIKPADSLLLVFEPDAKAKAAK